MTPRPITGELACRDGGADQCARYRFAVGKVSVWIDERDLDALLMVEQYLGGKAESLRKLTPTYVPAVQGDLL